MLRIVSPTHTSAFTQRAAAIAIMTLLTVLGAQTKLYFGSPVPVTLQVLVVLLAGMVLGARDGMLSQIVYLGLIALDLPVAAGGAGVSALTGATGGYLIGFIPAAFVAGWLVEHGADRVWWRWMAGIAGVVIIYGCGLPVLKVFFDFAQDGISWKQAWYWGAEPFILLDLAKALTAAGLAEGMRGLLLMRK